MKKKIVIMILVIVLILINQVCLAMEYDTKDKILVNIPFRKLSLIKDEKVVKEYPVAVGKAVSQTPLGEYRLINKVIDPYYRKKDIPGGSILNPLGSRWLGFKEHYGIHGNSNPNSIGTYASSGCIRMFERDVQELYKTVNLNTPVVVEYNPIEIQKDTFGENSIVVVERDNYRKINDIESKINNSLKKENLESTIGLERINFLNSLVDKQKVVFSNNWVFFINGRYVSNDIIKDNNKFYINKKALSNFFSVNIYNRDEYSILDGYRLSHKTINNKSYILLDDITNLFKGSFKLDNLNQTIDLNFTYLLLNNKLLIGEIVDIINEPKFSLFPMVKALDLNIDLLNNKISVNTKDNKSIDIKKYKGKPFIDLNSLKNKMGLSMKVFTYDKHIELTKEPLVYYKDNVFKAKIIEDEIYIPSKILVKNPYQNQFIYLNFQKVDIKYINGEGYIKLKTIENMVSIEKNKYLTKIFIDKK
ncbi:MAG: L,D-transpeptidase [Firmicutes bacterium]|nr:L,D-transpeptidase [Bacillota bacterium]